MDGNEGGVSPQKVHCNMDTDGGGWTLIAGIADDGQDTWTWSNLSLWQSDDGVGAVTNLYADYALSIRQKLPMEDLLFYDLKSGAWLTYRDVGEGILGFGAWLEQESEEGCLEAKMEGVKPTYGDGIQGDELCAWQLWVEGGEVDESCAPPTAISWGWSVGTSSPVCGASLDEAASIGGVGAQLSDPNAEYLPSLSAFYGSGGDDLNPGTLLVYVRSGVCGDGEVTGVEECDPADLENGPTCSASCTLPSDE